MSEETEFTTEQIQMGERLFAPNWEFVMGAPSLEVLPPADRPEIAFAGRSNVGKSSLINAIMRHKGLARTSNTPGRTQELNFFTVLSREFLLVDMPGYGFAKAPKEKVEAWTELVRNYLRGRVSLKRVFVLIDARHGVKAEDTKVMSVLDEAAVSYQLVLTKADKISVTALAKTLEAVRIAAAKHPAAHPRLHATSATGGFGLDLLRAEVAALLAEGGH